MERCLHAKTLQQLARSLAACKSAPWEKVKRLLDLCPHESSKGAFRLDQRGQDAVLALGIYFLESGLQYKDKILPYLLGVLRGLVKAQWIEGPHGINNYKLPMPECFSFCFNTILSDVAFRDEDVRDEIISAQLDILEVLTKLCERNYDMPKDTICRSILPILIGMARAIGRSSDEEVPLISCLLPVKTWKAETSVIESEIDSVHRKKFTTFRPIMPRTLSSHVLNIDASSPVNPLGMALDTMDSRKERSPSPLSPQVKNEHDEKATNPSLLYFNKVGSSFTRTKPWGMEIIPEEDHLKFSSAHLQSLVGVAKRLLNHDFLKNVDNSLHELLADENGTKIYRFPYRSFSETITLVIVTLLRDVLEQEKEHKETNWNVKEENKGLKSSEASGKLESLKPTFDGGKRGSTGVLSFFRGSSSKEPSPVLSRRNVFSPSVKYTAHCDSDNVSTDGSLDEPDGFSVISGDSDKSKLGKQLINHHIEIQFADYDNMAKYYCRVYFAEQFRKLRRLIFPAGEETFIRSLCRCKHWEAKGGKSGSAFSKTDDDRFILKQMSRMEVDSFEEFAPNYFHYITNAHLNQKPTALAKILGVYRIGFRNANTNMNLKQDLLVMENLFYKKKISQKFDLKGSKRNRLVNTSGKKEEDLVLLDENLLKYSVDTPLYIRPHSKTVMTMAIASDSDFLSTNLVMDYSLLVGVDEKRKELVIGIIDYIRTFTWDKKLEMVIKSATAQGKMPTVVSPELYRRRFLEAMEKYFLGVPDQWTGLGCQVDIGQPDLQT